MRRAVYCCAAIAVALTLAACGNTVERSFNPGDAEDSQISTPDGSINTPVPDGSVGPVTCSDDAKDSPAIAYLDDLSQHPGCATDPSDIRQLEYTPAELPGFPCAAKAYSSGNADPGKPIVLLIHGNSDTPAGWEACDPETNPGGGGKCKSTHEQLAEKLVAGNFTVLAVDLRYDKACDKAGGPDPCGASDSENPARNISHGWSVPIVQRFIRAVIEANPTRKISLVGHSFGVTTIRDALRRLQCTDGFNPWPHVHQVVLAAGANHGVSTFDSTSNLCQNNQTMRGKVICEMGSRKAFTPTDFSRPNNGANGAYETPCSDGSNAFGSATVCSGSTVSYTTVVMEDRENGTYKDEFVSQTSSLLRGADNQTVGLNDVDTSGYFFPSSEDGLGAFRSHFGAIRSAAAVNKILAALQR